MDGGLDEIMADAVAGETMTVLQFDLFPAHSLSLCLIKGVTNAAELRQEVLQQKFEASFIDAAMVSDPIFLLFSTTIGA